MWDGGWVGMWVQDLLLAASSEQWAETSGPSTLEAPNKCGIINFGPLHRCILTPMFQPYAEPPNLPSLGPILPPP